MQLIIYAIVLLLGWTDATLLVSDHHQHLAIRGRIHAKQPVKHPAKHPKQPARSNKNKNKKSHKSPTKSRKPVKIRRPHTFTSTTTAASSTSTPKMNNPQLFSGVPIAPLPYSVSDVTAGWKTAHAPAEGESSQPASSWSFSLANQGAWSDADRNAIFGDMAPWVPDGHTSSVPSMKNPGQWRYFFSHAGTLTQTFDRPFNQLPQTTKQTVECTNPSQELPFLKGTPNSLPGGFWLMGVSRLSSGGYVGFLHQEINWSNVQDSPTWWSIRVAYSSDEGASWQIGDTIISSGIFPSNDPHWGGDGNQGVVWDAANSRYICLYGGISVAMSKDPLARAGTWFKFDGKGFNTPALNSADHVVNWSVTGSNPSISFNTFLQKWLMAYHSNYSDLMLTTSDDLIHWDDPVVLVNKTSIDASGDTVLRYPTVTGTLGSMVTGQKSFLTFAAQNSTGQRSFMHMDLTLTRN